MSEGEIDGGFVENFFESLPEGFVANALARTTPRDVCRLSLVCCLFQSAAEWDAVWEKFLPEDYQKILTEAVDDGGSKKELYLRLCDHPLIIDGGNKSFWLDKPSGKKCYMVAARDLSVIWGDTPRYWRWIPLPESRFAEVAQLITVCWLEVRGTIKATMLSKDTCYTAYLVYKMSSNSYGFEHRPVEVSIGISGVESQTNTVFLDPNDVIREPRPRYPQGARRRMEVMFQRVRHRISNPTDSDSWNGPKQRKDGWLEIKVGEYFNEAGQEGELEMNVMEVKRGNWKGGLIIQGIEIRPKAS